MAMKSQRLFVGNIPAGTSEQELKHEFSNYGRVESIELKSKPNPLTESADTFAFINLVADAGTVRQCIAEFRQEKYKGTYLNVSMAKESFLDRLNKEREEVAASKQHALASDPYKKSEEKVEQKVELPTLPTFVKEVVSSSSESSDESEPETVAPKVLTPAVGKPTPAPDDGVVKKWNQETFIERGMLKIVPITGQVTDVIDNTKRKQWQSERDDLDAKGQLADEKRRQGLSNLKNNNMQQKLTIQSALAGELPSKRQKIVFDQNEYDDDDDGTGTQRKVALFDDGEEDDGFRGDFTARNDQTGAQGHKLHEMQTKFQGDSRFRLDGRFLEEEAEVKPQATVSSTIDAERKMQMEILSKVTGKEIAEHKKGNSKQTTAMVRFDPTKDVPQHERSKVTEQNAPELQKPDQQEEAFQVSEEKFYNVVSDIKELLVNAQEKSAQANGFSFLKMFGNLPEKPSREPEDAVPLTNGRPYATEARFKHESSDSEAEEAPPMEPINGQLDQGDKKKAKKEKRQKNGGYLSKQGIWKENFFFLPDDARLEEGRKFYIADVAESANKVTPRNVHEIRKVFRKRRYRENKIMSTQSAKIGLKVKQPRLYKKKIDKTGIKVSKRS